MIHIFIYVGMAASQKPLFCWEPTLRCDSCLAAMELYLSVGPGTSVASGPRKSPWRSPVSASADPVDANRKANGKVFSDISVPFLGWKMGMDEYGHLSTLQGTNMSPKNGILKMISLFPRWDMLISWRVYRYEWMGFMMYEHSWGDAVMP